MRNLRFFFTFSLLWFFFDLPAQNPFVKHYTTIDGLPSNKILQMYQDSKKFIWFATDAGLVRYDGSIFTQYETKDGLSYYIVKSIKEDASGRIWLMCSNGKWNFFFNNKIYNEINAPFLDSLEGLGTFPHNNDDIMYFDHPVTHEIYALDADNKITKYKIPKGLVIKNLSKSPKGDYLICTQFGFIKTRTLSEIPVQFSTKDIRFPYDWIMPIGNQIIYERIFYYTTRKWVFIKYLDGTKIDSLEFPQKLNYLKCFEDSNGLLWICTWENGVICLKNKSVVSDFEIKEGTSFMEDHEGNIWISAKNGVYKINPGFLYNKHYDISFFHNEGTQLLRADPESGVWSSNGKTIYLLENKMVYNCDDYVERCNQMCILNKDFLIYGNYSLAPILEAHRTNPVSGKLSFRKNWNQGDAFSRIAVNKAGKEFSGAIIDYEGTNKDEIGVYSMNEKIKENYRVLIGDGGISNIFYDVNDNLIINSVKNNYYLRNAKKMPCGDLSRFNGKMIHLHVSLNNYTDLYYPEDDSIYLINKHKTYNLTTSFGYSINPRVNKIIYDKPTLYLSNSRNIFKCDNPLNIMEKKTVILQLIDIDFRNIHDIMVYKDSLYIATDEGITIIPEAMLSKIRTCTPIPYFQSILINDKEDDFSQKRITLTGNNKIRFGFCSINYSASPVIYSYMLEGLDHDWTTGRGTNVVYQNLSRGNYIFKVRVRKATTDWSEPIEIQITIKAHFWQHPIFLVFLSLLFTGMISHLIIRRKNIQIKRRELDNQLITLEQKALQSMMNPHFIFNSLGSIQTYILQKKSWEAGMYLSQFARLIRQNLNAITAANISLEEEVDRLRNYLDLEMLRMENKFDYRIDMDENLEAEEIMIPSMIVQPFVENAIWHGISTLEEKGEITIKFRKIDEKSLKIIIGDNGIGMQKSQMYSPKSEKHFHLGMEMTRRRLELLGKKYAINTSIESCEISPGLPNPGTRVMLVIPVSYSRNPS